MSTENKGWMERAKEAAQGAMTEAGRRMNDVAERGKDSARDRWNAANAKVVGREQARQQEAQADSSKLSLGERLKQGIANTAERAKNTIDAVERTMTKLTESAERFSGNVKTAAELVGEGASLAATVTTETGKRALESLKNTPKWVMEGIKSAAARAEAARIAAAEKMKARVDLTIERGKALGVKIVEDVKGKIQEARDTIARELEKRLLESLVQKESLDRAAIANMMSRLEQMQRESSSRMEKIASMAEKFRAEELSMRTLEQLAYAGIEKAPESSEK